MKQPLLLAALLITGPQGYVQDTCEATTHVQAGIFFIENRGQWEDWVRYKAEVPGGAMFITDGGFAYTYTNYKDLERIHEKSGDDLESDESTEIVRHHAYYVHFINAKQRVTYSQERKRTTYHNYFLGNDKSKWAGGVPLYGKIIQEGVYDGIDAVTYSQGNAVKYEFHVQAGADPTDIVLQFEGVQPMLTPEGDLRIQTSVNEIIEQAPYSYQRINGKEVEVPSNYKLEGTRLSFEFPSSYNPDLPLVIDPTLVFATYSGGTGGPYYAHSTTFGQNGVMYAAGLGVGHGWPTTVGAFQTVGLPYYALNVCINKYDSAGANLIYSTYYSGSDYTVPNVMRENPQGELVLAGATSSQDLPVTTGAYDTTFNGNADLYVAHFNSDGTHLIGATFVGTSGTEPRLLDIHNLQQGGNALANASATSNPVEITFDSAGNIWVSSNTNSADFPVTPNAIQGTHGGAYDGVLFQLDPTCSNLLYSTYIGGSANDGIFMLKFINDEKIVVVGGTKSSDFPTTSGVLHATAPGGGDDGFVTILNLTTNTIEASSYLGTSDRDNATKVQVAEDGRIYVLGRTFGDYPITPGIWSMPNTDVYVEVLTPDLTSSVMSTRLGKTQGTSTYLPSAFLLDSCGNVYVAGLTNGATQGLPTTPDAFDTVAHPFWFCVLKPNLTDILFGSYFGTNSDHHHAGASHFSPEGVVYHSTCSTSDSYPTTDGVYSKDKQGVANDVISFKFDFEATGVRSKIELVDSRNDTVCAPGTVAFKNASTSPYSTTYVWDFGDGTTSLEADPIHTFADPGVYQVILKAYSAETCNLEDYDTVMITVLSSEKPDIFTRDTAVCTKSELVKLWVEIQNPTADISIEWSPTTAIVGTHTSDTVLVLPTESLTYTVKVGYQGNPCSITERGIHIDYIPRSLALLNKDTILCNGDTLYIEAIGSEGYNYQWSPALGLSDSLALEPYIIATESRTYTLTATHPKCADTSQHFALTVDTPYVPTFRFEPKSVCVGQPVYLYPTLDPSTTNLTWTFDQQQDRSEVQINKRYQHAFDQADTYPITLKMAFRACPDTSYTDSITVYPLPEVDLGDDSSICLHGSPIYLKNLRPAPIHPHHYLWSTGDTTSTLKVARPGRYTLSVITEPLGCTTTESIEISKNCYIDIPNAFTPNGDGHNDYFLPRSLLSKSISRFRMQVVNRWGQIVFETTNANGRGWDGRFNEQVQPTGVYVYRIEAGFSNGQQENYMGNVTLIR